MRRGEGWLERWREREVRDELVEDLRMGGLAGGVGERHGGKRRGCEMRDASLGMS